MPKLGDTQVHLGGSLHLRDLGNPAAPARYRARPFVHTTDVRLVDTGALDAKGERGMGLEAAVIAGPFHEAGEGYWQTVRRRGPRSEEHTSELQSLMRTSHGVICFQKKH